MLVLLEWDFCCELRFSSEQDMASELAGAKVRPDTLILLEPRYKTHSFGKPPSKSPLLAGTGMNHTVVRHVPSNVFNTSGSRDHHRWLPCHF